MNKVAPVTGITGQNCPYMVQRVICPGHAMHGAKRARLDLATLSARLRPGNIDALQRPVDLAGATAPRASHGLISPSHQGNSALECAGGACRSFNSSKLPS